MRADVQIIFKATPCDKQTMMFSATLSKEIRPICKLFMQDVSLCRVSMSCSIITLSQGTRRGGRLLELSPRLVPCDT